MGGHGNWFSEKLIEKLKTEGFKHFVYEEKELAVVSKEFQQKITKESLDCTKLMRARLSQYLMSDSYCDEITCVFMKDPWAINYFENTVEEKFKVTLIFSKHMGKIYLYSTDKEECAKALPQDENSLKERKATAINLKKPDWYHLDDAIKELEEFTI
jgi:hypothetical protein